MTFSYRYYFISWSSTSTKVFRGDVGPSGNVYFCGKLEKVLEAPSLNEALQRLDTLIEKYLDQGKNVYGGSQPL